MAASKASKSSQAKKTTTDVKKKPFVKSKSFSLLQPPQLCAPIDKAKGKQKAQAQEPTDDRLWVDLYGPKDETTLVVHKKKVADVRSWLNEAFDSRSKLAKYRRILALTGPAGSGKTATIRVLSEELDFDIQEWQCGVNGPVDQGEWESTVQSFASFLTRASGCSPLVGPSTSRRRVILVEDLPNLLHPSSLQSFHSVITKTLESQPRVPIILIVSDAGSRGVDRDFRGSSSSDAVDIRTVLPRALLHSAYVCQISFNKVAPTLLRKALNTVAQKASVQAKFKSNTLDVIVDAAEGDIRAAIMALQFAFSRSSGDKKERALLESTTRRENSLALFHLLGKILYNKRRGDPPSTSSTARDRERERLLDAKLVTHAALPPHLHQIGHSREPSRVNVDALYADSPIDSSLFSLYIHQNYLQFCTEVPQCESLAEYLSWADTSDGDPGYQANPTQFHLLSLGTLHSLPVPVPRLGQKLQKPHFFEALKCSREAESALREIQMWLPVTARWTCDSVVREMGGVLRNFDDVPTIHRTFSRMQFLHPSEILLNVDELEEHYDARQDELPASDDMVPLPKVTDEPNDGGWLEEDDIESD